MPRRRSWRQRTLSIVLFFAGLALLVAVFLALDPRAVLAEMKRVGWAFVPAFGSWVCVAVFSALSWRETLDDGDHRPPALAVIRAFWVGATVNEMTPTGTVGEVIKGTILRRRVSGPDVVASLVVYNYLTGAVILAWSVGGLVVSVVVLALPRPIVLVAIVGASVLALVVFVIGRSLRHGLVERLVRLVAKVPVFRYDRKGSLEHARSIDGRVVSFRRDRPTAWRRAVGLGFAARLFEVLEVGFLLAALQPDESVLRVSAFALFIQVATQLLRYAAFLVPGQVGVLESGTALLFQLSGQPPAPGLALELLRRARKVIALSLSLALITRGWGRRAWRRA